MRDLRETKGPLARMVAVARPRDQTNDQRNQDKLEQTLEDVPGTQRGATDHLTSPDRDGDDIDQLENDHQRDSERKIRVLRELRCLDRTGRAGTKRREHQAVD